MHILVPRELKSNPITDKASKAWFDLGKYARKVFAAQDTRRFVLGFTLLWIYDAAMEDPTNWLPAIKEELNSHEENGLGMPKGNKPIPSKWVFKRKPLPDGSVRYKARLVIRGFLQRRGVDLMETYVPTASPAEFRLLEAIAVFNGYNYCISLWGYRL